MEDGYPRVVVTPDMGIVVYITRKSRLPGVFTNEHYAKTALNKYLAELRAAQQRRKNKE
jgi:hypothetical protein